MAKGRVCNIYCVNAKIFRRKFFGGVCQSGSVRDAHLVEDWDISNLGIGEAIIGLPGKPPFKFKFKKT